MAAMMIAATGFAKDIKTAVFNTAPEMHCNNCENRIKNGLKFEKGVKDIKTDLETKTVTIEYDADKTSTDKLVAAFAKINYTATETKAGGCKKGEGHDGCKKGEGHGGCKKMQQAQAQTADAQAQAKPVKAALPTEPKGVKDATVKFKAEQMHCGGCANKVKRLMYTIDGVCWVDVDMTTKVVTVDYQSAKTGPEAMKEAFKTINYTVEDVK